MSEVNADAESTVEKFKASHHANEMSWQEREAQAVYSPKRQTEQSKTKLAEPALKKEKETGERNPKWTVAYYLGADKSEPTLPGSRSGASSDTDVGGPLKGVQIRQLAAETKGPQVTAFVDVLKETDASRERRVRMHQSEPSDKAEDYTVEHFKLHDGRITELPETQSKGMAEDIKSLVSAADVSHPEKIGLVINGDGGGNRGQKSDSSDLTSNDSIAAAIKSGLKDRKQLDILDFDECLMSQVGALDKFKGVSKDIVASAETERGTQPAVDGQNLGEALRALLKNPDMKGRQWGEEIVHEADAGRNDRPTTPGQSPTKYDSGTTTLANIDTSKVEEVKTAVGSLGKALSAALADPKNKTEIDELISHLPRFGADGPGRDNAIYQKRDLKTFADALQADVKADKLDDADGKIREALKRLEAAERSAVTAYHGQKVDGYDRDGGLSIYLPDVKFRNLDKFIGQKTDLADASEILDGFASMSRNPKDTLDPTDEWLAQSTARVHLRSGGHELSEKQKKLAKPLTDILTKLRSDKTLEERQDDLDAAAKAAHELLDSPLQKSLIADMDRVKIARERDKARDLELSSESPEWDKFVSALGWTT